MSKLRKPLIYLIAVTTVWTALSLGFVDLLLQPAATILMQKREAPMPPRIAAFYERKKEAAEYAQRTAERDKAAAQPLPPLPKRRVAHKQPPGIKVQVSAARRDARAWRNSELRDAMGYAPRPRPFFTPNDRFGN